MSKHSKPADYRPVAGKVVTIEAVRVIRDSATPKQHKSGKLNYLCKPPKVMPTAANDAGATRTERVVVGKGKYVGSEGEVWAFVWLEEGVELPEAANDPVAE